MDSQSLRRIVVGVTALVAVTPTLVSCGSNTSTTGAAVKSGLSKSVTPTSSSSTVSAVAGVCGVLTVAEASALSGQPMDMPAALVVPGTSPSPSLLPSTSSPAAGHQFDGRCRWQAEPSAPTAVVTLTIGPSAKTSYDDYKLLKHSLTAVSGIGDEAWEEPTNIFVRKGDEWILLNLITTDDAAAHVTALRTAAKEIAGRV